MLRHLNRSHDTVATMIPVEIRCMFAVASVLRADHLVLFGSVEGLTQEQNTSTPRPRWRDYPTVLTETLQLSSGKFPHKAYQLRSNHLIHLF